MPEELRNQTAKNGNDSNVIMGKKSRNCAAKRLQRKRQQYRKREQKKKTAMSTSPIGVDICRSSTITSDIETLTEIPSQNSGQPLQHWIREEQPQTCEEQVEELDKSTSQSIFDDKMFRVGVDEQDRDMIRLIKTYPLNEQCEELEKLFKGRTESMHYYIDKTDELREEMYEMVEKYEGKIVRIREFWKEKIYKEKTRSGKILKRALLN